MHLLCSCACPSQCAMFLYLSKQSFDHRKPEGLSMCIEVQEVQELN